MFSWGEDCRRGFEPIGVSNTARDDGPHHLNLSYRILDMSAGHNVLAYVKTNGNAFIMRTNEGRDGARVRGKQKFVKCKEKIEAVSCEDDAVTLLSARGSVLCVDSTHTPCTPRIPDALSNISVSQVACGSQHSVALSRDGQVYAWGKNSRGQLGLGRRKSGITPPTHVWCLSSMPLVQVSAGGEQSFALSVSGAVFSWGRNDCGQLGLGDTEDRSTPTSVQCLNLKKTSYIACGKDHTAILTKGGVVFTFGSGQHGQLGHNSLQNELCPRLVAELWGAKVIKIACGRHHTLVLTDVRKIYAFGCQEQGQLGRVEESHPSVPLPVQRPQGNYISNEKISTIFAGENCSFATCCSDEDIQRDSNTDVVSHKSQPELEGMIDKWISDSDSKSWKRIKQEIHKTFSSASCLNKSFLEQRSDKHFQTSSNYHGLNLKLARQTFKKLVKTFKVWEKVEAALLRLLPRLDKNPVGVEGLRIYLVLTELLHVIQKHTQGPNTKLAEAVAAAVTSLSPKSLQIIGDWWSSLTPPSMVRYVQVWKCALSVILSSQPDPYNSGARNLLLVLQNMYNVNSRVTESLKLPDSEFYLMIDRFLTQDLLLWYLRSRGKDVAEPLVLCNFPLVMDLKRKLWVFRVLFKATQVTFELLMQDNFFMQPFLELGLLDPSPEFFKLELRRASVLKDTFDQLAAAPREDYKRALMVHFDTNPEVDNVNVKDFFYEVFHEIVSSDSGMFMFNDSGTLAWFPPNARRGDRRFFLFGVLCGLALYNQAIIYFPFPLVLFKKLLGVSPSLEDLKEFSPIVGKNLQYILDDCTDDDIEDLCMDFQINWNGRDLYLDPKHPDKPVTSKNKKEFVDAYVNHAFNVSVKKVFQDFRQGFFQVCDQMPMRLFKPKELQEVLVGEDVQDWDKLKQNTTYTGEYHVDHPKIQMFWEVFDELSEKQKKAFLWFVTGYERVPLSSLVKIKMNISVYPASESLRDQYYPETETCFSNLLLPLYSTKEIMQTKLTEALSLNRRICQ
ncbi:E3 ISG15--protein ligase HERC5-like [Cololabis saira]|uniref:E3 ISG15--protein ligase HERC5-like n=1 Tax=Cololabis saira TaxID=129043 RepID=UPI002AD1DECF|nr:E3 ISG15--protein ligase HERC5-like [Cololabis saira]